MKGDALGGSEVRNVLKFSNGNFVAEHFLRELRNYLGENYTFPTLSLVLMKLFHSRFSFLIDGAVSACKRRGKEECGGEVLVEKIMKIGLLWA